MCGCWRGALVVKRACFSCRGPQLSSQNPYRVAHKCPELQFQRPITSSGLKGTCTHVHINTNTDTHKKKKIFKREKKSMYICLIISLSSIIFLLYNYISYVIFELVM